MSSIGKFAPAPPSIRLAAMQIAERVGAFGVASRQQLLDPSRAERRRRGDSPEGVTARQQPDRLEGRMRCGAHLEDLADMTLARACDAHLA